MCVFVCGGCTLCLSVRSMEYCTGLFVWGLEVCAHLVVGGDLMFLSEWREFPSAPCLAGKET